MLDGIEVVFDDMNEMLKRLKKKIYESNMNLFRNKNEHYFHEMTDFVDAAEDKAAAESEIAEVFIRAAKGRFERTGKISSRTQADMNFMMIYYVFPSILLTNHAEADNIAKTLCAKWGESFKDSKIGYTDYDKLYNSFNEKIFGIF